MNDHSILLTSNGQWMDKAKETLCNTLLTEQWLPTDSKLFIQPLSLW